MIKRYFRGLVRLGPVVLAFTSLGLASCGERLPTYRYRMTVEVETPEGLRTGSSVIEVENFKGPGVPGPEAGGIGYRVRGEAVTVDLGARGTLFALLRARDDADRAAVVAPAALVPDRPDKSGTVDAWRNNLRTMKQRTGATELSLSHYPMLVRFRDMQVPNSVEEVNPNDLQSKFGNGLKLKRIIVQITDDKPTFAIEHYLPWLNKYRKTHLDGVRIHNSSSLANGLDIFDFKRV
jgi:hypothetical protein